MLVARRIRSLLLAALTITALVAPDMEPASAATEAEQRFHRKINRARVNRGLRRLHLSSRLSNIAREHSRGMASRRRMYHHSCLRCELRSFSWRIAGENVGVGYTVRQIHRRMMRSRAHRYNILRRGYRRVGIGTIRAGDKLYVTQIFLG
ncbi:MAG TPA: CAP domain-containing protein [Actinomycetota bacterium]|nr:CAP domain-containing protein [Actinomycetota bacterium]